MIKSCAGLCSSALRYTVENVSIRYVATESATKRAEETRRKNAVFDREKNRQFSDIGRIEKIEVKHNTWEEEVTLLMNKNISTPYDCARHLSEGMAKMSALAFVNGAPWDMHKPLEGDCELKLATMKTPMRLVTNVAFWRSCSLMLGAVVESAFKDSIEAYPYSFNSPNIKSGSFLYDAQLGLENWQPTVSELRSISAVFAKLAMAALPFERLETTAGIALEVFQQNPHKSKQIPDIAANADNKIILYRIGDYIDISKGPVVGNTGLVGRCTIASVHKIQTEQGESLYRFQGVALPSGFLINHFTYGILENRAKKLNESAWMPNRIQEENDEKMSIAANN